MVAFAYLIKQQADETTLVQAGAALWLLGVALCFEPWPSASAQAEAAAATGRVLRRSALIVGGICAGRASASPSACRASRCWTT
jgi:hypothetical protein